MFTSSNDSLIVILHRMLLKQLSIINKINYQNTLIIRLQIKTIYNSICPIKNFLKYCSRFEFYNE